MRNFKTFLFLGVFCFGIAMQAQEEGSDQNVRLSDIVIDGEQDDKAKELIEEVIIKQKENSPQSLEAYEFKSYSKVLSKSDFEDKPDFEPQNKEEKQKIKNYKESLRAHDGLIEKGTIYAYTKTKGEKIITDAVRISGIQTPLLEIAALDPLPYGFDQDEFQFFYFRSFINPLSRKGLQHYEYLIQDTILLNERKTIEVSFKNLKSKEKPLYGSLFIDLEDKALAEFHAEYKNNNHIYNSGGITIVGEKSGEKKYFLNSQYQKIHGAWFPVKQEYNRLSRTRYHVDSTTQNHKEYYRANIISAHVAYFNHQTQLSIDEQQLNGYKNEISKEAFNLFNQRIPAYRVEPLSQQEQETYVMLDSIGREENVNAIIKYGRFFVNGFNLPLGKIDFYLPSIYGYNAYEGVRLGGKLQTNRNFHQRIGLEGAAYYGFNDKDFKYMLGANYLVEKNKNSIVGVRYVDDVMPFARPVSPLRSGVNYLRESFINGENENYIGNKQIQIYGNTTFLENLDFLTTVSYNQEQSKIPYGFKDFDIDKSYEQVGVDFFLRYSPNNEYIAMPYGRLPSVTESPDFYITGDFNTPAGDKGYESLRLQVSVEHAFSWFNKTGHILLRGGKVFGEAPLWRTFNQGLRGDGSWFKPWQLGSSNNFETMPAMQFYSEQYVMAQWRQEWFNISKSTPVYTVVRGIYGDFDHTELHKYLVFDTLKKGYLEGGIEVRRVLLNALGLGAYYRFGAYHTDKFEDNFALKFTLDLPFGNINF